MTDFKQFNFEEENGPFYWEWIFPVMTNKEILDIYNSDNTKNIYGYMYGKKFDDKNLNKIIEIDKESLDIGRNKDRFFYVWGYPGPDYNVYLFKDYGKTWAFSREEIND
jgi:hypothetical protein